MKLTEREREVLLHFPLLPEAIAERFVVSVNTVRTHIYHIYQKYNLETRSAVLIQALRNGDIKLDEIIIE